MRANLYARIRPRESQQAFGCCDLACRDVRLMTVSGSRTCKRDGQQPLQSRRLQGLDTSGTVNVSQPGQSAQASASTQQHAAVRRASRPLWRGQLVNAPLERL